MLRSCSQYTFAIAKNAFFRYNKLRETTAELPRESDGIGERRLLSMNISNINFASFVHVAEAGSFNKAAEELQRP